MGGNYQEIWGAVGYTGEFQKNSEEAMEVATANILVLIFGETYFLPKNKTGR